MSERRPRIRHRDPAPTSCAGMWAGADEPVWGTAAPAAFWVALEQPGPWGHKALTQSRLDPAVGGALEQRCAAHGGRALLIRSTGDHQLGRSEGPATRRLFVSGGMPAGRPWLLTADITDPADVLRLPFDALVGADTTPVTAALPALRAEVESVLLVCTNARRDACCAVLGRPVALDAGARRPGRVWECTHTGGHRFAPTAVALPTGTTLARLTTDLAVASLDAAAAHEIAPAANDAVHHRGLSHLAPALQAADAYLRAQIHETDVTALTHRIVRPGGIASNPALIHVEHADGRGWDLLASKDYDVSTLRKNSCVTGAVAADGWVVVPDEA